jgi:hypothetical protein
MSINCPVKCACNIEMFYIFNILLECLVTMNSNALVVTFLFIQFSRDSEVLCVNLMCVLDYRSRGPGFDCRALQKKK